MVPRLIWIFRIQCWGSPFSFLTGNTLFGQIWSEDTKSFLLSEIWCQDWFKDAKFNSDAHFFRLESKIPSLGKFGWKKIKIVSLSWNLIPKLIRIDRFQWWFFCSVFEQMFPYWVNFLQNIKIVSLSWNSVQNLIQICTIRWWCSFFLFSTRRILFFGKFISKNRNCLLKLKFRT